MRTSYTDISPDAKPTPTTSIAGDWAMEVIPEGAFLLPDGAVNSEDDENLCMQALYVITVSVGHETAQAHYSLSSDIPQLHASFTTSNKDFVDIRSGMHDGRCGESGIELYRRLKGC